MNKEALRVIDRMYPNLRELDEVKHYSEENESSKYEILENYFSSLENLNERVKANPKYSEERIRRLKEIYYKWCLIKRENIPESVYEREEKEALERGFGHIKANEYIKDAIKNEIIENQKKSLDVWIDYFISDDSKFYPFWAKYWAFRGMLSLGYYNKEEGTYNKRSETTTAPFAELNREALGITIDLFIKSIGKEKIENDELEKLVKTNSFQKIYLYSLNKLNNIKNNNNSNEGIWIKYDRESDPTALVNSLKGKNTGWCTAAESTAKLQLLLGDFYVYYTLDNNNEYKNPRIAIRMEGDSIGEIRGIGKNQNIEPEMEKVVEKKLQEFPDKDLYYKKVNDMKMMTKIYKKYQEGIELSKDDLRFLYEIDSEIEGFGYYKDPRIEELLKARRSKRKDYAEIFECDKKRIALKKREISEDTVVYFGDIDLGEVTTVDKLVFPKVVIGSINLKKLSTTEGLVLPEEMFGSLALNKLESVKGLKLPKKIRGVLELTNLKNVDELTIPEGIKGFIDLNSLTSAKGLIFPKELKATIYLKKLESAEGLILPEEMTGSLVLKNLESAEGLKLPKVIEKDIDLRSLKSAEGLIFPKEMKGSLILSGLESAEGLVLPERIDGDLDLRGLKTLDGLNIPEGVDSVILPLEFREEIRKTR